MARINELLEDRGFVNLVYRKVNEISIITMSPRLFFNCIDPKITDEDIIINDNKIRALTPLILEECKNNHMVYTEDDIKLFIEEDVLAGF